MNKPTFKDIYFLCIQKLTNFPFIEQDFDALTNYELLCKVVEYLNKVIANENVQNESIIALYNAFNTLKDYVDNYFENLDVQEEINDKLDEMAEDGTLQEIVADYLNSKAIFGFDTVADMKEASNLIDGSYAKTLGYHEKNDDGASLYKIRTITNDDVVDEMQIIELANDNLIAEWVNENNVVRPEQFGAYGDNDHDDSTILNSIITISLNKNYKIVGNKVYKTNNPIVIVGNNLNISLNKINYIGVENAIYLKGIDNTINIKEIISGGVGLYIACDNLTTNTRNKINIDIIRSNKHGIYFYTDSWGIYENYLSFVHIIVTDHTCYGIYLKSDTSITHPTSYINQTVIYGGRIDGAIYGLYADAENGQINELLTYNISAEGSTNGIYLNKVTDSTFDNWRLEELTNEAGHLFMKLVGDVRGCQFKLNRFTPLDMIDRTELTNPVATENVLYGNIRDTRANSSPLGSLLYFWGANGLRILNPIFKSKSISSDTTLTEYEFPTFFNVSADTTATVTLNKNYNENAINSFYVYVRSGTNVTFSLNDGSYSVTITRTQLNHVVIVGSILLVQ